MNSVIDYCQNCGAAEIETILFDIDGMLLCEQCLETIDLDNDVSQVMGSDWYQSRIKRITNRQSSINNR